MKVLQFPLAKITILFIIGILMANYFVPSINFVFLCLTISSFIFVLAYFGVKRNVLPPVCFGISTMILALVIGINTQLIHNETYNKNNYTRHKDVFEKSHLVSVIVREKLRSSLHKDRYVVILKKIDNIDTSGKLLLNVNKDSLTIPFEIGTRLQIGGHIYKNNLNKNPNQFDYGKYLENKQIYAQIYSDISAIKISSIIHKDIWYYSSKLRTKIIQNLEKSNFNKTELNVAIALILGQQQDISPEIIKDYQFAGAVHILSVSGLHIGFILIFVTYILKPIPNTKKGSFVKLIIILTSLCSFGVIAGLAPSVLRSVTMFSFVAVGMYFKRATNVFHTVLVSMLLILLFQPSFLFDVGFQLSYLALFFILWLQPLLAKIWCPKNKIANYFWEILTVSFAAQIGTLPLSIFYFHQFPGLFFVTNLVVIPFLTLIMGLGVVVMGLAAVDFLPEFLAKLLEWSINILNQIINSIASLEDFIFKDIPINLLLMLILYFILITAIIWLKKPSFNKLVLALITIITFQIAFFTTQANIGKESELIIFNSKKHTIITERYGHNIYLYANDSLLKKSDQNQVLSSYALGNFSHVESKKRIKNLLYFEGKKILILDSLGVYPEKVYPDIVLLTQSPKINFERFLRDVKPKTIVADASNYRNIQKLWSATCLNNKIPFHATAEKGFYIIKSK
jgi:competence protein ComEC